MKRLTGFLGLALAGAALTVVAADTAFAQRGGRGGRGGGSGWGGGGSGYQGTWGGYRGGWSPGSGFYAYPRGYGYGYGGYYDGYRNPGYSSYYYPGYSYPYSYGSSYPYSYGYSQGYAPDYGYSQGYPPSYGYSQGYAQPGGYQQAPMAQANSTARVEVKLPDANGEVWFDGQKTRQMGATRTFTTPPLDGTYQYQVSAAWHQDGRLVTQDRTVSVKPGANVTVDFTQGVRPASAQDEGRPKDVRPQDIRPQDSRPPDVRPQDRPPDDRIPQKRNPVPDRRDDR
jgi:uncharacterized protein (TIGR03000 family)